MKIRQGFVSNSSSSSFIVVITKSVFDDALKLIEDKRYVKVLKYISKPEKRWGEKLVAIHEYTDTGGYSSIFGEGDNECGLTDEELHRDETDDGDGDLFYPSEALDELQNALEKLKKTNPKVDEDILILTDSVG